MSRRVSRVYRALLYLLPATARRRDREELLAAFLACREHERTRLGAMGSAYAWFRAAGDIFVAAIAIRGDARRARRIVPGVLVWLARLT